jgi:hypothetical protein
MERKMSIAQNFPNLKPSLLLDFSNTKALDPRITFTRASTGTFYGTQTAKAEENLLVQSQDFTTTWANTNTTDTANTDVAPDGTTTADTIADTAATAPHDVTQSITSSANATYVYSCFLKNGTRQYAILASSINPNSWASAKFDLSAGTAGSVSSAGAAYSSATSSITSVGNGWYRCTLTFTVNTATTLSMRVGLATDGTTFTAGERGLESYLGNGSTILAWGAQLEQRSAVTAYTPTTTQPITNYVPVLQTAASGVARFDHNPITDESLGLLIEEQRTNLLLRSEEFDNAAWGLFNATISANVVIAPDGTLTGDKLVENTTTNTHFVLPSVPPTVTAGITYTVSIFAKAAERGFVQIRCGFSSQFSAIFNLTTGGVTSVVGSTTTFATPVGNGWWRVAIAFAADATGLSIRYGITSDSTTTNYTGNGFNGIYIWGAQLE